MGSHTWACPQVASGVGPARHAAAHAAPRGPHLGRRAGKWQHTWQHKWQHKWQHTWQSCPSPCHSPPAQAGAHPTPPPAYPPAPLTHPPPSRTPPPQFLTTMRSARHASPTASTFVRYASDRYVLHYYPPHASAASGAPLAPRPGAPHPKDVLLPWMQLFGAGGPAVPGTVEPRAVQSAVNYHLSPRWVWSYAAAVHVALVCVLVPALHVGAAPADWSGQRSARPGRRPANHSAASHLRPAPRATQPARAE